GRTLAEAWADAGMAMYKGTAVHGFPNLFSVLGANTGQGHTSVIVYIEALTGYVREAIRTLRRGRDATRETAPPAGPCGAAGTPRSSRAPTPRTAGTPTSSAGWAAPSGCGAGAPPGTST